MKRTLCRTAAPLTLLLSTLACGMDTYEEEEAESVQMEVRASSGGVGTCPGGGQANCVQCDADKLTCEWACAGSLRCTDVTPNACGETGTCRTTSGGIVRPALRHLTPTAHVLR